MVDESLLHCLRLLHPDQGGHPSDLRRRTGFAEARTAFGHVVGQEISDGHAAAALVRALERLGYLNDERPCATPEEAAQRLETAVCDRTATVTWCVPLDRAEQLPQITFGPARVRIFEARQLADMSACAGLAAAGARANRQSLAQLCWLVVEEQVVLPDCFKTRLCPFEAEIDKPMDELFQIQPHPQRFAASVEMALGALLVLPWEEVVTSPILDWRPFRTPWLHLYSSDLFAQLAKLPSATTLTWEKFIYADDEDYVDVDQQLSKIRLRCHAEDVFQTIGFPPWQSFCEFLQDIAAKRPIGHFLVRAFMNEGIDELISQLLAVESALGHAVDFDKHKRPTFARKNPGATPRLAWRLAALLDDTAAETEFFRLYNLRSDFIHGREMDPLAEDVLLSARRLAQRCIAGCLSKPHIDEARRKGYDAFLDRLLQRGHRMCSPRP